MNVGIIIWSIFGCTSGESDTMSSQEDIVLIDPIPIEGEPLDSLKLARRISLDIRGKYLSSAVQSSNQSGSIGRPH